MNTGRRALGGAAWSYSSQVVVVCAQFAYAAVTSRILDDHAFGAYAIALSVTALVTLLATGGLGQAVARMHSIEPVKIRALSSYAILIGTLGAIANFAMAPLWGVVWGSPASVVPIQWFSLAALLAPMLGLWTGLAQRLGKFRQLAIITLSSNLVGMSVGLLVVLNLNDAVSLLIFPLIAQFGSVIGSMTLGGRRLWGLASIRHARTEVSFSKRLIISNLLSYGVGNVPRIAASRFLGTAVLGQFNRAEVLSSVPFQQLQASIIAALYPEFRHDIESPKRAHSVWTDLLVLTVWLLIPFGAFAAVFAPMVVPFLFGSGWDLAAQFAGLLCIAGSMQVVSTLLASAVEALGRFKWVWGTQIALLAFQGAAVAVMFYTSNPLVLPWSLIATNIVRHLIHVSLCIRRGYLDGSRLAKQYLIVAAVSAGVFSIFWLAAIGTSILAWSTAASIAAVVGCAIATLIVAWLLRRSLPPLRIATSYGLLRRGPSK